ncbi:hypothetical protein ACYX7E_14805 [Luteimonas sp. RIT-PG2_3]
MKRAFVAVCLLTMWGNLAAQSSTRGPYVWEKYGDRISASSAVAPLSNDVFGDRVSLSNGALSFSVTDIILPGNDALPVAFERQYSVHDRRWTQTEGMLADWDLNLPSLGGIFNPDWLVQVNTTTPATSARCSTQAGPPKKFDFSESDFWRGITLNIPGGEAGQILRANTSVSLSDGKQYDWVTGNGRIRLACLPEVKNSTGEGFVAVTADGTRYWFDWMAQVPDSGITDIRSASGSLPPTEYYMILKQNTLYATRIEDRFGNSVDLTYTNAWNQPAKLTRIQSSDGRILNIQYTGKFISSVNDGARTWSYAYTSTPSGRTMLSQVTLPDASRWTINFYGFTHEGEILYRDYTPVGEIVRDCMLLTDAPTNVGATFTGAVTHPSGAVGTFVMDLRLHGRSNVPISCKNVNSQVGAPLGTGNNPNDDVNLWATSAYSFTLKQKYISGPGLSTAQWNYAYEPGISVHRYPGTTHQYPVCDWQNYTCSIPPCRSEACAGFSRTVVSGPNSEWTRYTHGNSYLYNEGKLLKVERGSSASSILSTETYTYDLSMMDKVYPAAFGSSLILEGGGFSDKYPRPLQKTVLQQDGMLFTMQVDAFDALARPVTVTKGSAVAP